MHPADAIAVRALAPAEDAGEGVLVITAPASAKWSEVAGQVTAAEDGASVRVRAE